MKRSKKRQTSSKSISKKNKPLSPFARALIKRVQNNAYEEKLWQRDTNFLVGVSGGSDSLCLLDILSFLAPKYNFSLHVAHVNYGLRGKDSLLDEALVKKQAAFYGWPITTLHSKEKLSGNLEEKLRDVRYRFFEKVRRKEKLDVIAVAHNEDEQAETFLLRLLRGSGLSGLSGMRAKNDILVRPLLKISKKDILRYMKERSLPYREDKSNQDIRFFRNRIRHELIPLLESDFQPRIKSLLSQTAEILAQSDTLLKEKEVSFSSLKKGKAFTEFSRKEALSLSKENLSLFLRSVLKEPLSGKMPSKKLIDELEKCLKSTKNKPQMIIFHGLKFEAKGDKVRLLY